MRNEKWDYTYGLMTMTCAKDYTYGLMTLTCAMFTTCDNTDKKPSLHKYIIVCIKLQ